MSRWFDEGPDHAAEWLSDETRQRGSGITARTPRPSKEVLYSFELEHNGAHTSVSRAIQEGVGKHEEDTALARLMDMLLDRLSTRQREVLDLVAIGGLTFGAAAKELGISKASVYSYYTEAVERLRLIIEETPWAAAIVSRWLVADDEEDAGNQAPRSLPTWQCGDAEQ